VSLSQLYNDLNLEHAQLLVDFKSLNQSYVSLNRSCAEALTNYNSLKAEYESVVANYTNLSAKYQNLFESNVFLQESYTSLLDIYNILLNQTDLLNSEYNRIKSEYSTSEVQTRTLNYILATVVGFVFLPLLLSIKYYRTSKSQTKIIQEYKWRMNHLNHADVARVLFKADVERREDTIKEFERKYNVTVRPSNTFEDAIGSLQFKKKIQK